MASDSPNQKSVLRAMHEHDRINGEAFLQKYSGGRPPRGHYIEHDGKRYPLKALWAAAKNPRGITRDFQTATARKGFVELGFSPIYLQPTNNASAQLNSDKDRELRLRRLANAPRLPTFQMVETKVFDRNADVVAEALYIANGMCGACGAEAPFLRASNQQPYLEVHHRKPLANGGEDTIENAIALCPNCHRRAHYG